MRTMNVNEMKFEVVLWETLNIMEMKSEVV